MIDRDLFGLMKVTLKEVLRAELSRSPTPFIEESADELVAKAYRYAISAKQCLDGYRPHDPLHDPHAPTMHPPPRECENSSCSEAAIDGSDFCGGHQY